jgi:MFS family permease
MPIQRAPQPPGNRPRFFYGYIVVGAALFIMLVMYGVYNSFGVFFEPVLTEFGWSRAVTSGGFSLSWIMQGLLGVIMGRLTDRFGPRVVLTICGFIIGLGYLIMSQVSAVWQIYLFYGVIIGAGMGGSFVPIVSTVARWFTKRRNIMTGIVMAGVSIGTLITPPVASRLIAAYDWRISYIIAGSVVLVVIVLVAQLLRRDPTQVGQRPYGEKEVAKQGYVSETYSLSLRGAAHTKQFWLASGMFFCIGFCSYTMMTHIVLHATDLGISSLAAANILATIGGFSILGRVVLGSIADRIGNRQAFIIGFILMSASLIWLVPAKEAWGLYLSAVIFGFAFGCATSESPLVAELFGLRSHGLILGVINLIGFTLGAAIGPFIAGYIFDVTNTYQLAFIICGATAMAGLILSIVLRPIKS